MILSTSMLLDEYKSYSDPFGKIKRTITEGNLYKITKSVYETDNKIPGYCLAPVIYGPSYLSFDYALSRYGLIPEKVCEFTSATFGKGKTKTYSNNFGNFSYRDVPKDAYPFETVLITENRYTYSIATPEKALCDKLYTLPPVKNLSEMNELLFENLRIDETEFLKLNSQTIEELSEKYKSTNVRFLSKLTKKVIK